MEVKDALKRFRDEFGLTQTQAAQFAGVSVVMYQFYEYGRHEPKVSALAALAEHFGVSMDYLTGADRQPGEKSMTGARMKLSDALRRFRKGFDLTQRDAASAAGVTESVYQKYEYGTVVPRVSILIRLSETFNVSLDYLAGLSTDPARRP